MVYLIVIVGLILRLISLNQSLWLDEATTALVSKMSLPDVFSKFLPGDFHPPFYYLLMRFWVMLFGNSEISLRIPSVLFGLGTIFMVYLISARMFNKYVSNVASLLTATSGLLIYYSQEARMYILSTFLVSLLFYLLIRRKWFYFSSFLVILGMTDYAALLSLPFFWFAGRKDSKNLVISHIPLFLVFGIWSKYFLLQLRRGLSQSGTIWWQVLGVPTFKNVALIPTKFILGRVAFTNTFIYSLVAIFSVLVFSFLLFKARSANAVFWMWLITPVVTGLIISFKIPTLSYFRFLFCLPPFYILASFGLYKTKQVRSLVLIVIMAINIFSSGYYLLGTQFHREDWRDLVKFVESQKDFNSMTVFVADSNMEAYKYYAPQARITGPESLGSGYNQLWLMRYAQTIFDPNDKVRKSVEALGYQKAEEFDFNGVVVWKYLNNKT